METVSRGIEENAHAQEELGNGAQERGKSRFVEQGEKLLQNFQRALSELSARDKRIQEMDSSMKELRGEIQNLKRKAEDEDGSNKSGTSETGKKKQRVQNEQHNENSDTDELDNLLHEDNTSSDSEEEIDLDIFNDIDQFFEVPSTLGTEVNTKLADVLNRSLRSQPNEEKFKKLLEHYPRPANMDNLQTPKVDVNIWKRLPTETKSTDVLLQKETSDLASCLVPIIRILEATQEQTLDKKQIQLLASDSVKMMTHHINHLNNSRKTKIKKAVMPKFKPLCDSTKTSATQLFGDTLKEDIKALNENPTTIVNIPSTSSSLPFLSRGGARGMKHQMNNRAPHSYYRSNPQQNNRNNGHQQTRKQKTFNKNQVHQVHYRKR